MTIPKSSQIKKEARDAMIGQTKTAILNEVIAAIIGGGGTIWTLLELLIMSLVFIVRIVLNKELVQSSIDFSYTKLLCIVIGIVVVSTIIAFVRMILKYGIDIGLNKYSVDIAFHPEKDADNKLFKNVKYFMNMLALDFVRGIKVWFFSLFLWFPGIIASIKYSMADFVIAEYPTTTSSEAMIESEQLIDGYKWRYFKFTLSFIPWILLSFVTFGIALLWVIPYIRVCRARFYYYLKNPIKDASDDDEDMVSLRAEKFSYEDFLKEYNEKHPEIKQQTASKNKNNKLK